MGCGNNEKKNETNIKTNIKTNEVSEVVFEDPYGEVRYKYIEKFLKGNEVKEFRRIRKEIKKMAHSKESSYTHTTPGTAFALNNWENLYAITRSIENDLMVVYHILDRYFYLPIQDNMDKSKLVSDTLTSPIEISLTDESRKIVRDTYQYKKWLESDIIIYEKDLLRAARLYANKANNLLGNLENNCKTYNGKLTIDKYYAVTLLEEEMRNYNNFLKYFIPRYNDLKYFNDPTYTPSYLKNAPITTYESLNNSNSRLNQPNSGTVHVKGYYRNDGTYVRSHERTWPDGNPNNNFSSK